MLELAPPNMVNNNIRFILIFSFAVLTISMIVFEKEQISTLLIPILDFTQSSSANRLEHQNLLESVVKQLPLRSFHAGA